MAIPNQKIVMKTSFPGNAVNFNKDGSRVLFAASDYIFCLDSSKGEYNMINCKEVKEPNYLKFATDLHINSNEKHFAYSTIPSYSVNIGSIYDEKLKITLKYFNDAMECRSQPSIYSVRFSSCGTFLLCAGVETMGCMYIFDLIAGIQKDRLKTYFNRKCLISVAEYIGNSSNIFVTGDEEGLIYLWDTRCIYNVYQSPVSVFRGHSSEISYIDSLYDDTYILSSSSKTINIHDLRRPSTDYRLYDHYNPNNNNINNSIIMHKNDGFLNGETRAKYSPIEQMGRRYIYTGCGNGRIIIYDVLTGEVEKILKGRRNFITDATWHPIRKEFLSTTLDSHVNLNTYENTDFLRRRSRRIADRNSEF